MSPLGTFDDTSSSTYTAGDVVWAQNMAWTFHGGRAALLVVRGGDRFAGM